MNAYATDLDCPPFIVAGDTASSMSRAGSKMVEFSSAFAEKTSTEKMHAIVKIAAQPIIAGESSARSMARAARRLGLGMRRVKSHWYLEAKQVDGDELDKARQTALGIADRLYARVAALEAIDADFYRPEIDATRHMLVRAGFVTGAGPETGGKE